MAELKKYLDTTALGTLVDQIKAEDAKVLQGAKDYADGLATNYDAAGAATGALSDAKAYTDQLANGQVATNKADIAKLNGDASTEGSVAKAIADAKAVIDGDVDAVEAIANQNKTDIAAINNAESGILAQAKGYTDTEVAKVQGEVDNLETYVGTFTHDTAKTVVEYINAKTDGIATSGNLEALGSRVTAVEGDVATIKGDYLKAADKTELEGEIGVVQTAVDTEKSRAEGIEAGLRTDVDAIKGDYLKAADKTELEGKITTNANAIERLTNGVSADEVDGVNDLINYVKEHGTEVTGMQEDIADNASAIEGVAGRMTTAEGKITAVEGAVATKVEQSAYDEKIEALEGADASQVERIAALEAKFGDGEGNVEAQIAAAKQEAIDEADTNAANKDAVVLSETQKYTDGEIDKVEATIATLTETVGTKAAASDVTALTTRVTDAEGEIDTLQSEMDAVEAKAAANETAIGTLNTTVAGKAAQTDLDNAVARIATNEGAISTLNGTVADKADADDLDAAVERIAKNEGDIATLTSAVNSFTPITSDEVNALFA